MRAAALLLALFYASCACDENNGTGDAGNEDTTDGQDRIDQAQEEADRPEVIDAWDIDAVEDPSSDEWGCFHASDVVYDFSALGLSPVDPPIPPYECSECCIQVTFASHIFDAGDDFDIWEDLLVLADRPHVPGLRWALSVVNLNTFETYELKSGTYDEGETSYWRPAIYMNHVYAIKDRLICDGAVEPSCCPAESPDCFIKENTIVHIDLSTGVEEELFPPVHLDYDLGEGPPFSLDASERSLTWDQALTESYGLDDLKIHKLDLATGVQTVISDNEYCCANFPVVWGDNIVWDQYYSEDPPKIFAWLYNTTTLENAPIMDVAWDQWAPSIWGTRIVYADSRNGGDGFVWENPDIFMMDLESGEETQVCSEPSIQYAPDIHGDVVVWMDQRNDPTPNDPVEENVDVYARNLATGEERNMTPFLGPSNDKQRVPRVFGHRAFFVMLDAQRPSKYNVFMIDLKGIGFVE